MSNSGFHNTAPFVLAIQNEGFRESLANVMKDIGFHIEAIGQASLIYQLTREQYAKSWVILDTDDDVAWLVQLVNDYHRSIYHLGGEAPIICLVSNQAFATNQRLGFWLIDGSAAVYSVWDSDTYYYQGLFDRFQGWGDQPVPVIPPECPTYDELVTRVIQESTQGQNLLDLGVRLEELQESHRTRYEVAHAFYDML